MPDTTRTCDLRIRSALLYPVELRAQLIKKNVPTYRRRLLQPFDIGVPKNEHHRYREKNRLVRQGRADIMVGVAGFEPATLCSQSRCANRAALHPELAT